MTVTSSQAVSLLENVLFESPDAAVQNAANWTGQADVSSAAATMSVSPEAGIPQEVARLYLGVLGRLPSAAEVQYYVTLAEQNLAPGQLAQGVSAVPGQTWTNIVNDFVNAPEFKADLANSDLISVLYHNVLGRTPSSDEIAYYQTQMSHGATTAMLVRDFVDSPEYQSDVAGTNLPQALALYGAQFAQPAGSGSGQLSLPQAWIAEYSQGSQTYTGGTSLSVVTVTNPGLGAGGTSGIVSTGAGSNSGPLTIDLTNTGSVSTLTINLSTAMGSTSHTVDLTLGSLAPSKVSVRFDSLSDSFAGAAVDVSRAVTEAQALDLAASSAGTLAAGSVKLEWFQFGGDTYIVDVTNAGAASTHTALAATDYVVKLTGLIDLSAGSFNGGHNFTL